VSISATFNDTYSLHVGRDFSDFRSHHFLNRVSEVHVHICRVRVGVRSIFCSRDFDLTNQALLAFVLALSVRILLVGVNITYLDHLPARYVGKGGMPRMRCFVTWSSLRSSKTNVDIRPWSYQTSNNHEQRHALPFHKTYLQDTPRE
jgi:hypothetical protein